MMGRFWLLCALLVSLAAAAWAQTPEEDPRAALITMGERIQALRSYQAEVRRVSEATQGETTDRTEAVTHLSWERPNRVRSISDRPEGRVGVVCDGERLVVWSEPSGEASEEAAPSTLAGIDRAVGGLEAEGLAIGGLFFSEKPVDSLIADFESIHDLGHAELQGRRCRLVGLENDAGLRMVLWIDEETWLPLQAIVDASATFRDLATAANVNSRNTRVTVTETHENICLNPTDLEFDVALPASAEFSEVRAER